MVKAAGLPDSFVPLAMADPTLLSKIVETQAGVGGSQTDKEYKQAVKVYQDANPNQPLPPELQTEAGFAAGQVGNVAHAKEMQDFNDSGVEDLASVEPRFDKGEKTVDTLLGNMDATMTALQAPGFLTRGPVPGYLGGGPYGKEVKDAAAAMATLKATLAGEGLKNTKNVRNVREFNTLAESMTAALDPSNSPAQVEQALRDIKSGIARAHAQALAVAGKQVPYAYKGLADQRYFIRGGPYDTGATQEDAPADNGGGGGGAAPPKIKTYNPKTGMIE
jgi:tetrahydromethanopterin S-methyltransferase subunit B